MDEEKKATKKGQQMWRNMHAVKRFAKGIGTKDLTLVAILMVMTELDELIDNFKLE